MFLRKKFKGQNQNGDTIIEVMIVLAVLGMAISIAYSTASRSLLNMRRAQESSTATTLAQTQVEMLRTITPNGKLNNLIPANIPKNAFNTTPYCINNSGGIYSVIPVIDAASTATCRVDSLYDIRIHYCEANAVSECAGINSIGNFVIKVTWADVSGGVPGAATITYRSYPRTP